MDDLPVLALCPEFWTHLQAPTLLGVLILLFYVFHELLELLDSVSFLDVDEGLFY